MDSSETYLQRFRKVARRERRSFWTSYRWWLTFTPAATAILLDLARKGLRAMTATELALNSVGGAAVAFLGTLAISFCRAPRLLDDERIAQLGQRQTALEASRNETKFINAAIEALTVELAAERNKDKHPEITGVVANFRYIGRGATGDLAVVCEALLCNIRPARTNLRRIVIDASAVQPRLVFSNCSATDVLLEQGISKKIEVRATLIPDAAAGPHETVEIDLSALKVSAVDGFGNRHALRIEPGTMLFLNPDEPSAPSETA